MYDVEIKDLISSRLRQIDKINSLLSESACPSRKIVSMVYFTHASAATWYCVIEEIMTTNLAIGQFIVWRPAHLEHNLVCTCTSKGYRDNLSVEDREAWVCPMHTVNTDCALERNS